MTAFRKEHEFRGRLAMIGFGCIGQGILPLLLRHIAIQAQQMLIIDPLDADLAPAKDQGGALSCPPGSPRPTSKPCWRRV